MQFEFATASRIIFGPGKLSSLPALVNELGTRIIIFNGAPPELSSRLIELFHNQAIDSKQVRVSGEPTVGSIRDSIDRARNYKPDVIVGIGGGSTLDTAKAVAVLLNNPGDVADYLEVIGQNFPLRNPGLPFIAVPTTAGTGTEVTRNAVLGATEQHVKVSLRSPFLLARVALIDPELTLALPPAITATTGLDALTQLIEPFTSNSPNPLTDALCEEGIRRVARSLRRAFDDGNDLTAREDLSLAALLSGMALANSKLGAVHGFAAPIGGEIPAQHGAICASLLPAVMSTNLAALSQRLPQHPALERYTIIARLLTGKPAASPEDGIQWIREFNLHAGILPLAKLGLTPAAFPEIIEKAQKSSSMKGNPILLSDTELRMILEASL